MYLVFQFFGESIMMWHKLPLVKGDSRISIPTLTNHFGTTREVSRKLPIVSLKGHRCLAERKCLGHAQLLRYMRTESEDVGCTACIVEIPVATGADGSLGMSVASIT